MGYADPAKQRDYQREWARKRRREFMAGKSCEVCGATKSLMVRFENGVLPEGSHNIWGWAKSRRDPLLKQAHVLCKGCSARVSRRQGSELTFDKAQEIRRLYAEEDVSKSELARRFGVDRKRIREVLRNSSWVHTTNGLEDTFSTDPLPIPPYVRRRGTPKITPDDVRIIRRMANEGYTSHELAEEFALNRKHVWAVVVGKVWKEVV